jgi:outer membrane protein
MNRLIASLIILVFVFTGFGFQKSVQAAEVKIGYIDVAVVFDSYDKTKEKDTQLNTRSQEKKKEHDRMVDNIKNMKNELELLSDNEKQKKQDLIDTEVRKLQDFDKEAKEGLQRERDDMVREILKEIDAVIKDYASKNGFTLVLNNRVLVYAEEQYDITKEILNILNSKYRRKK